MNNHLWLQGQGPIKTLQDRTKTTISDPDYIRVKITLKWKEIFAATMIQLKNKSNSQNVMKF